MKQKYSGNEKFQMPRADFCYSDPPLVDYNAIIPEQDYEVLLAKAKEREINSHINPMLKIHTDSEQNIKFDSSFLNRIKAINAPKALDRHDLSNSESNMKFTVKAVKK